MKLRHINITTLKQRQFYSKTISVYFVKETDFQDIKPLKNIVTNNDRKYAKTVINIHSIYGAI